MRLSYLLIVLFITLSQSACTLSPPTSQTSSSALNMQSAAATTLGKAALLQSEASSEINIAEQSGIKLLENPLEAYAARVLLANAAERTLDLQYYIWETDLTGSILLKALYEAAERGVRVRLLLDDNGIAGLDDTLLKFSQHPNIDVRIFNPFRQRSLKVLGYVTDFTRVNHRMHNKSFTADNSVSILGGRNIGDDYFGATEAVLKQDLDLVAIGKAVDNVSQQFDMYWASQSAYPISEVAKPVNFNDSDPLIDLRGALDDPNAQIYADAIKQSDFIQALLNQELSFTWASTQLVTDSPTKALGTAETSELLLSRLYKVLGKPEDKLILVSPYFVPSKKGSQAFISIAQEGVEVHILTNAMEATDVLPVHAGYAKHRKNLLKAGVKLYELRANSEALGDKTANSQSSNRGSFGSSASSLHAKTFSVDGKRMFVGSFNFDPRSALLNTELGLVINSEELAQGMEDEFFERVLNHAYEVKLNEDGDIIWIEHRDGVQTVYETEPGMSVLKRAALGVLTVLPIDWLL